MAWKLIKNTAGSNRTTGEFFTDAAKIPAAANFIHIQIDLGVTPIPGTSGVIYSQISTNNGATWEDFTPYYFEYTGLPGKFGDVTIPSIVYGIPSEFKNSDIRLRVDVNQDVFIGFNLYWDNAA